MKRIFYIDYFNPKNSNFYWLKAFRKFGEVEIFDIGRERHINRQLLRKKVMDFKPHHIHLGGSVRDLVPLNLISDIRRDIGSVFSVFYGDARSLAYHAELAKIVDCIYMSTYGTQVRLSKETGLNNFRYMPCPTDPEVFKHYECPKIYDVVFIGNEHGHERKARLQNLAQSFNLTIFGNHWGGTDLNVRKPVYGRQFSEVCSKAKINIGLVDDRWINLEAYFSNRLINILATGSFYIQPYTRGLERVFTNRRHLVWHTNENELVELIKYYLMNEKEREVIATEGQKEVYQKYTYEKSAKRILEETRKE